LSLLIVRCPLKPFSGSGSPADNARDWSELNCAERFEWCLVDGTDIANASIGIGAVEKGALETGVGTTESMPYADEVLVLIPTIDVRLIEAKVPLANAKKLQQILPNLIEEYVLTGAQSLAVQAFSPVPGKPALQRVIALIDRAWFEWLSKQLEGLISQRVRLIPECLLLPFSDAKSIGTEGPTVAYERTEKALIFTQRTGEQLGVAWVEKNVDQKIGSNILPKLLKDSQVVEFSSDFLIAGAKQFLKENASPKSANYSINLLPKTFKRETGKGLLTLSNYLKRKRVDAGSPVSASATWANPAIWRQPAQWSKYLVASIVVGYLLHLGWLVVDNWRWGNQIEVLAAQSLTPSSIAKLNQEKSQDKAQDKSIGASSSLSNAVIIAFTKQVTQDQRRQGLVSDADFAPMAAKLQQLKAVFGPEVLQKIDYDGYGINFEFKPSSLKSSNQQTDAEVVKKARSLGLMVKVLGPDRYRLEPYAGLGLGSGS
jgi:Type II secretion system (T2SS), protein L